MTGPNSDGGTIVGQDRGCAISKPVAAPLRAPSPRKAATVEGAIADMRKRISSPALSPGTRIPEEDPALAYGLPRAKAREVHAPGLHRNPAEPWTGIQPWIDRYNLCRPHAGIGHISPWQRLNNLLGNDS